MSMRYATPSDLDSITWIAIAASPNDPIYPYRYPHRTKYPEDYAEYTRIRYSEYLADKNNAIMVFELPSIEDKSVNKPVAFSIWTLPPPQRPVHAVVPTTESAPDITPISTTQDSKPRDRPERRDVNLARKQAFRANILANKKRLFDEPYHDQQLYLGTLMCHPDYQRRGAGTRLVEWGITKARAEDLIVTLFASPWGYSLYRRLGFDYAGEFRTQVAGEDKYVDSKAMVLKIA
ncbi:acyl-CoA N-acyltransferase [Nemania sp. FL0031]|nr:acyl-CoA N-acyltransferase [Nemania sp. FL0031]